MKRNRPLLWGIFVLVLIVGTAVVVYLFRDSLRVQNNPTQVAITAPTATDLPQSKNPPADTLPPVQANPTATAITVVPVTEGSPYPPVAWVEAPPCQNLPEGLSAMTQAFLAPEGRPLDLRRAQWIAPGLAAINANEVNSLMANLDVSNAGRQALIGLAVNIASGRINRATQISFASLPEIQTAGDLLDQLEAGLSGQTWSPDLLRAGQELVSGNGIVHPVCAHLLVTQNGARPVDVQWTGSGIQASAANTATAASAAAATGLQNDQPEPALDTVTTSPDGRWAAFTSISYHSGGPLMLMNLKTGEWFNLIEKMNAARSPERPALPIDGWWDLIGWMPDSRRLAIGPSDASTVYLVDITSGQFEVLPFNGGGNGGAMVTGLSPDGSQMAYIELTPAGDAQALSVYNFAEKQSRVLLELPYSEGMLVYPRFSPDGRWLAYVIRKGNPNDGFSEAIHLYDFPANQPRMILEGNLGLSVPAWSPDGQYLAFTRKTHDEPERYDPANPNTQAERNIWVMSVATGKLTQVTSITGLARRPLWSGDSQTLSFITHDGQVGMVNITRPGQIWQAVPAAAGPAAIAGAAGPALNPLLTSVFFVP